MRVFTKAKWGSNQQQPKLRGPIRVIVVSSIYLLLLPLNVVEIFNSLVVPVDAWYPNDIRTEHATVMMFLGGWIAVFIIPIVLVGHHNRLLEAHRPTKAYIYLFGTECVFVTLFLITVMGSYLVSEKIQILYDTRVVNVFEQLSVGMNKRQVQDLVEKANSVMAGASTKARYPFSLLDDKTTGLYQVFRRVQVITFYHDDWYYLKLKYDDLGMLQKARYHLSSYTDGIYHCTVFFEIPDIGQSYPPHSSIEDCVELADKQL